MHVNSKMIRLISPNSKSDEFIFYWQQNAKVANEENKYITNTIYWVIHEVDELLNDKDLMNLFDKVDIKSYSSVKELAETFNKKLKLIKEEWAKHMLIPLFLNRRAHKRQLHHIIDYCYSRAVDDPDKLNQYVPFSAEVYGETSFELVDQIIDWVKLEEDDVFIDLGSGVGQVVLQVAASTNCKSCSGIEKAEYPAQCALTLDREFKRLMKYFGKPYKPYQLLRGDFLSEQHQETISCSSVIFANNFAFGPLVDHQLKNRFTSLREGAKIISSKAFCPLKFRITDRNLDDIGSIMRVTCLNAMENAVSWTCSAFSYYLHQVDHSMLEEYFAKYKLRPKEPVESKLDQSATTTTTDICGGDDGDDTNTPMDHNGAEVDSNAPLVTSTTRGERILRTCRKQQQQQQSVLSKGRGYPHPRVQPLPLPNQTHHHHHHRHHHRHHHHRHRHHKHHNTNISTIANVGSQKKMKRGKPIGLSDVPATTDESMDDISLLHQATLERVNLPSNQQLHSINGTGNMIKFANSYSSQDQMFHDISSYTPDSNRFAHPNLGHSEHVIPLAVDQYLQVVKENIMKHIVWMNSDRYREDLLAQITEQRHLKARLEISVAEIEKSQLPRLVKEGVSLLDQHMYMLGIQLRESESTNQFFSEARKLIKEQARVETEVGRVRTEIGELVISQRRLKEALRMTE